MLGFSGEKCGKIRITCFIHLILIFQDFFLYEKLMLQKQCLIFRHTNKL